MESDATGPESAGLSEEVLADRLESLERRLVIARRQGDYSALESLLAEARELAPGSAKVLEWEGDDFAARGRIGDAVKAYRGAHELAPDDADIERKFAEAVIATTPGLDAPLSQVESFANAKKAAVLSALVPGLGQLVMGQRETGLAMLSLWLLAIVGCLAVPNGVSGLLSLMTPSPQEINVLVLLPMALGFAVWLWAINEASARAKRHDPKHIQRPEPPVDKPFEL